MSGAIAELRRRIEAMTPRPWNITSAGGEDQTGERWVTLHVLPAAVCACDADDESGRRDLSGIVALVNLADDLLRLAALVRIDMEQRGPHLRHELPLYRHLEALEARAATVLAEIGAAQ